MPCTNYINDQAVDIPLPPINSSTLQTYPLRSWTIDPAGADERTLIVSNAPETIAPPTNGYSVAFPATLYKCEIELSANVPKTFRVFFWHVNQYIDSQTNRVVPLTFNLLASTDGSQAAQITNHVKESRILNAGNVNVGDLSPTGICLAKSQLFDNMTATTPNDSNLAFAESDELASKFTETVLGSYSVGTSGTNGVPQSFGALHDFTVTSPVDCKLRIRTCVTNVARNRGKFDDAVMDPHNPGTVNSLHIRGWWPRSDLRLSCSTDPYDVGVTNSNGSSHIGAYGVIEKDGVEGDAFAWQGSAIDPYGSGASQTTPLPNGNGSYAGNKGLYGVNCHYRVQVKNSRTTDRNLWIVLRARDSGAIFFGATETTSIDDGSTLSSGQYGVPVIAHRTVPSDSTSALRTTNAMLLIDQATLDPTSTREYTIDLAAGGAAGLPVSILVSGESPFGWRFQKNPPPP